MWRDVPEGNGKGRRPNGAYILLGCLAAMGGCAASHIYFVPDCERGLALPYQRVECRACVEMPIPHEFLPDNPDGARCVRR